MQPATDLSVPAPPIRPAAVRSALHRLAGWAALLLALLAVGLAGLHLRKWAWDHTEPIRYVLDIDNAFRQGTRTLLTGYVDRYDNDRVQPHAWTMELDYAPGRLAVATLWAQWVRARVAAPASGPDPALDQWTVEFYPYARHLGFAYALCRPLLMFNLTGELLAAAAAFGLVRRYASGGGDRPVRGNVLAAVAASLFWLNPALITNAHCWPQWDSWVLPFLLWAVLLASWDLWFCAGVAIAAGTMFKGQILFGVPVLLVWPLCQGRVGAAGRWTAGLASGVAAETAVWLVRAPGGVHGDLFEPGHTNPDAVRWVVDAAVAAGLVILAVRGRRSWAGRFGSATAAGWTTRHPSGRRVLVNVGAVAASLLVAAALVVAGAWAAVASVPVGLVILAAAGSVLAWAAWRADLLPTAWAAAGPVASAAGRIGIGLAAVAVVALPVRHVGGYALWPVAAAVAVLAGLAWAVPARSLGHVAGAWVAAALLLCWPVFGGSGQWFQVGIAHGTTARNRLSLGDNNNLADLLANVWGWTLQDPVLALPAGPTADHVAAFLRRIDKHVDLPPGRPVELPLKYVLLSVWAVATVACAAAAARHDRRRDPRFLIAVAAPWVVMFAVLGQMHQRYLLWGAALTCMAAGVSPGLVVLSVLLSVVSAGQELLDMSSRRDPDALARLLVPDRADGRAYAVVRGTYSAVRGWTPGMGWAVVLTAGVFVYAAVGPWGTASSISEHVRHLPAGEEDPGRRRQHERRHAAERGGREDRRERTAAVRRAGERPRQQPGLNDPQPQ